MSEVTSGDGLRGDGLGSSSGLATFLVWPIFLACSWTWVIGMYLPLVLRERYGWWGYVVFAVPNIAGVMLFAWGVKNALVAREMVIRYRPAMLWFSVVTAAFHGWFFGWIWTAELGVDWCWGIAIGLAVMVAARVTAGMSDRVMNRIALLVYAVSIGLMISTIVNRWGILVGDVVSPRAGSTLWPTRDNANAWMFLTPVMVIGFLLCPYFDLTFHRAYQAVEAGGGGGRAGRRTFVMFGFFFGVMILFTAVYAVTGFTTLIVVQLVLQGWLTTTMHLREILALGERGESRAGEQETEGRRRKERSDAKTQALGGAMGGGGRLLVWLPMLAVLLAPIPRPWVDYRDWLLFYGLLFPIYALLREVRRRLGRTEARSGTVLWCMVLCIPFGAAGFLGDCEWALVIPTTVVVLMAIFGGRGGSRDEVVDSGP